MARTSIPAIVWGDALEHTLHFGYSLDAAVSYPEPRQGSEWAMADSGVEDSWVTDDDEFLEADVGWIPQADTADPLATGWDGASGWRAFLSWARRKNTFRFVYDGTAMGVYVLSYLSAPMEGAPPLEDDGTRRLHLRLRSAGGNPYEGY